MCVNIHKYIHMYVYIYIIVKILKSFPKWHMIKLMGPNLIKVT